VAVLDGGVLDQLWLERTIGFEDGARRPGGQNGGGRNLVGDIFLGRVQRVLPAMQAAFINIGLERAGFLAAREARPRTALFRDDPYTDEDRKLQIADYAREGSEIVVQVVKDPIGSKGARLTTQLSVAGRLLVYLPQDPHIGISQRIEDEAERESLREKLHALIPPGETGGFIVRTVAEAASESELSSDVEYLVTLWKQIQLAAQSAAPQALLYQDLSLATRVLRDLVTDTTERIIVDSRETFGKVQEFAARYTRQALPILEQYVGERPLFDLFGVEDEIERALARRVDLKSGGYVIIDQTEALTTVDVNTGGFVSGRSFDDTIFKTNLEAAQAIARQLRLRNLGGIIILDFIDMDSLEHRNAVLEELRRALARDRTRVTLNGFSALGLVEMTRKRTRESLAHVLCEPCPICAGRGEVRTAHTVCYDVLREILREARAFNAREFRVIASQAVIDLLLEDESASLTMLSDFIGKPISVQVETGYSQEQFDIVLM
jgi:ribonuclease G